MLRSPNNNVKAKLPTGSLGTITFDGHSPLAFWFPKGRKWTWGFYQVPLLHPWLTQYADQEQFIFFSLCLNVTKSQGVRASHLLWEQQSSVQTDLRTANSLLLSSFS